MTEESITVIKVGGSLLRGEDSYRAIARILAQRIQEGPTWVVLSAAYGMTDALEGWKRDWCEGWISTLLDKQACHTGVAITPALKEDLEIGVAAARSGFPDALLSWGERASVAAIQAYLSREGVALPILELASYGLPSRPRAALVPGFYLRERSGEVRCLPRGGSDISAVLVATALGSSSIRFWKEGGGIRAEGGVHTEIDTRTLLTHLTGTIRPLHPEALRLALIGGIRLTLEDPFQRAPSTVVRGEKVIPIGISSPLDSEIPCFLPWRRSPACDGPLASPRAGSRP